MGHRTVVVLGGALAGPTAAERASEIDPSLRVILLERARQVGYSVGDVPGLLGGQADALAAADRERARFLTEVRGVEVRTGVEVLALDAASHRVLAGEEVIPYDALVFALGAASVLPDVDGLDGPNVLTLRTPADARAVLKQLERGARRVAVLGGGPQGLEIVEALRGRRCRVTLLERGRQLLPAFGTELSRQAEEALRAAGVDVRTGVRVRRAERRRGRVVALSLPRGESLAVDLVLVAAGVRPRTELLQAAGVALRQDGSVAVDERCATGLPDVYACGVCVAVPRAGSGRPAWLAQAAVADKTAQVAGANAAGGQARLAPVAGTQLVRAAGLTLATTGLTGRAAGKAAAVVRVHPEDGAGEGRVTVHLWHDEASGRVLGAEVAASTDAARHADLLAAAVAAGLTVDQLASLDLAHAVGCARPRDAVNVAATVAAAGRAGLAPSWSADEIAAQGRRVTLVDVRRPAEIRQGTTPGAVAMPVAEVLARAAELPQRKRVVFVSTDGRRAYLAARAARAAGLTRAGYLSGGLRSWQAAGHPLGGAAP